MCLILVTLHFKGDPFIGLKIGYRKPLEVTVTKPNPIINALLEKKKEKRKTPVRCFLDMNMNIYCIYMQIYMTYSNLRHVGHTLNDKVIAVPLMSFQTLHRENQ